MCFCLFVGGCWGVNAEPQEASVTGPHSTRMSHATVSSAGVTPVTLSGTQSHAVAGVCVGSRRPGVLCSLPARLLPLLWAQASVPDAAVNVLNSDLCPVSPGRRAPPTPCFLSLQQDQLLGLAILHDGENHVHFYKA